MARGGVVVSAAALGVAAILVGSAAYQAAREEPAPPTTTTTTTRPPTRDEVEAAIAAAFTDDLEVDLTAEEAGCVTTGLVELVGSARVDALAEGEDLELTDEERTRLVRVVVECLPPEKAGGLLREIPTTTTTVAGGLPDEGAQAPG